MLANISEIITDVRSLINEENASFWSDTEITRWVNEGQLLLSSETGLLSSYYTKTLEASDIVNDREIRVNTDFIALDEGGLLYNGNKLDPISFQAIHNYHRNWKNETGTPTKYYMRGDLFGFYPKPSVGDTVSYYGIERATELEATETPFNGDYRTVPFRVYIRDYAVGRCWYKKNEMTKYKDMMGNFEYGIRKVNSILNKNRDNYSRFIPEYRPKSIAYGVRYGRTDVFD
jgi:hypothetical protein